MSKYTKYRLYQKYETRGSQEAIPCYPNLFSVDGDGTMPLVIVEENSRDCGYTGETQPIYRWYTLPIDTYYYCDACQDAQYKWVNLPISQDWECDGTTKYYKQKKQVSVDGGSTWTDVVPPQYQRGAVYEYSSQSCGYRTRTTSGSPYCEDYDKYVDVYSQYSTDGGNTWQTTATTPTMVEHNSAYCGYIEPQYRTTTGDTYCSGVNKYVPVYSQVSYDGGVTWETTATTQTLVERNSPDCGYGYKLRATFSDSSYYDIVCNSDPVIRMYEAQDNHVTGMTSLDIGTCVTEITKCAFDNGISYPNLVSVTLPNTLTTIGNGAFQGCDALPSITIPDSVTSIDSWAFSHLDSLRSAVIGNGLSVIKSVTFYGSSNLASVTIGTGVTTIEDSAFYGCGLTSLTIPNSVTTIGRQAFSHNSNLASLTIGNGVTSIEDFGFGYCGITSLTIPNSVTSIGSSAFWGCNSLSSATIGSGVTAINFFQECANLRRLNSNVDGVINIPSGVTTVDFYECPSFTSISIPNTVSSVTLTRCSGLTSVVMPDSVTHVGSCAGCASLTSVEIGTGVTSVDNYSFQGCSSLTSYTIRATTPPTVGEWAFNDGTGCPIYVPCESLSAYRTRSDWTNFRRRVQPMPNSCTTPVPPQNFDGKIFAIYNDNTFYSGACDSNTILTSADTQVQGYTYTAMTSAIIGDCVTEIGASAFKSFYGPFYSLSSVTIGSGVTTIGASAFSQCYALSSVTIPDSATTIRDWAFNSCGITSLTIPDSVTSIDWHAFQSCSNLASATIGSGLTSISAALFYNCRSLTSVTIPDTVTSINSSAFTYCTSLVSINIPNGVTSIASNAFYFCTSLTSVTIPDSVTEIDWNAFSNCSSLTSIEIPSGVTYIGDSAFTSCDSLTSITINATTPPTLENGAFDDTNNCPIYVPVDKVSEYKSARVWSNYSSRIQPNPLQPIKYKGTYSGGGTYYKACDGNSTLTTGDTKPSNYTISNLRIAEIGDCTTYINASAFTSCNGLTSVTIADSVRSIYTSAFKDCINLRNINIPSGVTYIGSYVFSGCSSLPVTDYVRYADTYAVGASVKTQSSYSIKNDTKWIGDYAFDSCSGMTSVTVPDSVKSIGIHAFYECRNLTSIDIPSGVTYIGQFAFYNCYNLSGSLNIPSGVSTINGQTFYNCRSLTSVTIPSTVGTISYAAFYGCSGLTSIAINATTPPYLGSSSVAFDNTNDCPIYVPSASVERYKAATGWSAYASRIQTNPLIPIKFVSNYSNGTSYSANCDSNATLTSGDTKPSGYDYTAMTSAEIGDCITEIGVYAFYDCRSLTNIGISSGVTSIGQNAFYNCTSLTSVTIPDSVTSIGSTAFGSCSSLTSLTIPDSVASIGNYTFNYCTSLNSCTIGSGVTSIGDWAFSNCGLTSIDIPSGVTSIGTGTFQSCYGLSSCTIGSGVTSIGSSAFGSCSGLTSIDIPDSVLTIGDYCFSGCKGITSVIIGSGVTDIGSDTFDGCYALTSVTIKAVTPPAMNSAFTTIYTNPIIYVPAQSVDAYKSASGWSDYASRIQAIP